MTIQQYNNPYLWYLLKPNNLQMQQAIKAYEVQRKVEPVHPSNLGRKCDERG
jgi:hypothetical protein